ncbi:MAG: type II toxin-antitoxin system ParD family antitoxin [Candidatus Hydrogenedentes bacterium]|nr:type II toxin-antitoxin system ParD family antitoxin [Candidatus Hydrogenedentota bacterium]
MTTQTIDLPEEQAQFIREIVASGRYPDETAVVRAALQLLEREEEAYRENLEELRAEVRKGLDDIEAGRYIELSSREEIAAFGREISRRGMERLAETTRSGTEHITGAPDVPTTSRK